MRTTIQFLFFLSFFVSILMGVLSLVISRHLKSKEFRHLSEFWFSLVAMTVIAYVFMSENEYVVALSLLGWIWPIKAILRIAEDMSGVELFTRSKPIILAVGGFLTLILASYNFPFKIYTAPFSISVGVIGAMMIGEVYKKKVDKNFSILRYVSFILLVLVF